MQSVATSTIESIVAALQLGRPQDAERLARDYLVKQPSNQDGLILLSMSLMQQDRPADATSVCRELTQLVPQSAIYWSNLGTALRDAGELREAEEIGRAHV